MSAASALAKRTDPDSLAQFHCLQIGQKEGPLRWRPSTHPDAEFPGWRLRDSYMWFVLAKDPGLVTGVERSVLFDDSRWAFHRTVAHVVSQCPNARYIVFVATDGAGSTDPPLWPRILLWEDEQGMLHIGDLTNRDARWVEP